MRESLREGRDLWVWAPRGLFLEVPSVVWGSDAEP